MNKSDRIILLVIAIFAGAFIPFFVLMFGLAVGDGFHWRDALLFIATTILISSPIWIPAIIPNKYKLLSLFFRWLGAISLLMPAYFYSTGKFVTMKASFIIHIPFIAIVLLCFFCIWILVKPDLIKRT